jgi:predicted PurR-regulated permease PerM
MDDWLASAHKRKRNVRVSPAMEFVVVGGAIVSLLYFGRVIFFPLALAVLLSFALSPVVLAFRHIGLGRVISVLTVACLAFLLIVSAIVVVVHQLAQMGPDLPRFQVTTHRKNPGCHASHDPLGSSWKGNANL